MIDSVLVGSKGRYQVISAEDGNTTFHTKQLILLNQDNKTLIGKLWENPNARWYQSHALISQIQERYGTSNYVSSVIDHGETRSYGFVVFSPSKGKTVEELVYDENTPISEDDQKRILLNGAAGLHYFHERNVIHGDATGENLKARDGHFQWIDFDILEDVSSARRVQQNAIGTPAYMAPEVWCGKRLPQSDVYAFGIVMYEVLTGNHPFGELEETSMECARQHFSIVPARIETVSSKLANIVAKSLEKSKNSRFRNGTELKEALQRAF